MKAMMKRLVLLMTIALMAFFVAIAPTQITFAEGPGEGLEISPAIDDFNAEPGRTYTVNISVTNTTSSTLMYTSSINDFGPKDETGAPAIILDDSTSATSIKEWVTPIPDFTLSAHEKKDLSTVITVPANAEPGGHYGVIRFSGVGDDAASHMGVDLTASAGTLVLIKVSGDIKEKLNLLTFEANKNNKPGSFFESGPITFVTRFQNTGTTHVKPIGQIEVKDSLGNKVDVLQINKEKGNVLPGGIRRFEATLDKSWMFGHYTADISIAYGTTGQAIVETIGFWVVPIKLLLVGLIGIATVVYIFSRLIKRYNSYIIKQANANKKTKRNKQHGKK